jgi:tetratricopeptide (TPR) repeat protein
VPESLAEIPRFRAAFILSKGMDAGVQGNVLAAIEDYKQAQIIDTGLRIDPDIWDLLCWVGVLHNQAKEILFASEIATHLEPDNPVFRDTRGLVRALTGDTQGAIEDFETVVERIGDNAAIFSSYRFLDFGDVYRRLNWLEALRLGQNPFTLEIFGAMRKKAGIGCDGVAEEAEVESREALDFRMYPGMFGGLPGIRQRDAGSVEWDKQPDTL